MTKTFATIIGIAVFIGLILLLKSIIDATDSGGSSVVGIIALIIIVVVFPGIAITTSQKAKEKGEQIKNKIAEQRETTQIVNQTKQDLQDYQSFKHSYSLCSDNFLITNYRKLRDTSTENMETLAIEEEMVKRGLLDHSPMHEKLLMIKKQFGV